jgi:hypothetical protein
MQIETHTAELLAPDSIPFEVKIGIAKSKMYNSVGRDQSPA